MLYLKRVIGGVFLLCFLLLIALVILGIVSSEVLAWLVLIVLIVGMAFVGFGNKDSAE